MKVVERLRKALKGVLGPVWSKKKDYEAIHYRVTENVEDVVNALKPLPELLAVVEAAEELKQLAVPGDATHFPILPDTSLAYEALEKLLKALDALRKVEVE